MTFEVSSHGLVIGRLRGLEFDIAIFSNLTQDHLDFHGTMEAYGHAKSLLFSQLGQDYRKDKYVILNADDPYIKELIPVTPFEIFTYGIDNEADFMAKDIEESISGVRFTLETPFGSYKIQSPYLGKFNVLNLLASIIGLWAQGYELNDITEAVENMPAVEGRLEVLDRNLPIDLIIDYAHTPDGMDKLIDAVKPFVKQN